MEALLGLAWVDTCRPVFVIVFELIEERLGVGFDANE